MVKSPKIEMFENFEKSAPSKIENLVDISMFFNEMVIRPTNKVQETHLWYWFFKPDRLVKVSDFLKWFQSDFFKNRLKLEFFLSFATVLSCTVLYSTVQYCTVLYRPDFFPGLFSTDSFPGFFSPDFFLDLFPNFSSQRCPGLNF